jgi:hypothetical protein
MATPDNVRYVEDKIGYKFTSPYWPTIALTAAGAEEFNHDGNRLCARHGRLLIEWFVLNHAHDGNAPTCMWPATQLHLLVFSSLIISTQQK